MSTPQVTPEVLWAQRSSKDDAEKNYVYVTISVPDVPPSGLKLDLKPTSLTFTGTSESKKTTYHLDIEFYKEIDVSASKTHHTPANIQMVLRKKELEEAYWPRLLKDKAKVHYLRTDFDKWVDEDEQNEAPDDDYMNQFGGGGTGEDGGFGGIDFSQLGNAGGSMPGMEGLGGGDDEDSDEEDVPGLEDEETKEEEEEAGEKAKAKPASKIEEIP